MRIHNVECGSDCSQGLNTTLSVSMVCFMDIQWWFAQAISAASRKTRASYFDMDYLRFQLFLFDTRGLNAMRCEESNCSLYLFGRWTRTALWLSWVVIPERHDRLTKCWAPIVLNYKSYFTFEVKMNLAWRPNLVTKQPKYCPTTAKRFNREYPPSARP